MPDGIRPPVVLDGFAKMSREIGFAPLVIFLFREFQKLRFRLHLRRRAGAAPKQAGQENEETGLADHHRLIYCRLPVVSVTVATR